MGLSQVAMGTDSGGEEEKRLAKEARIREMDWMD